MTLNNDDQELIKSIVLIALLDDPKFIYNELAQSYNIDQKTFIRVFHSVNEYEIDPECDEGDNTLNDYEVDNNKKTFLKKFKS